MRGDTCVVVRQPGETGTFGTTAMTEPWQSGYDSWKTASPDDEPRGGYWDEDNEQDAAEMEADRRCDDERLG